MIDDRPPLPQLEHRPFSDRQRARDNLDLHRRDRPARVRGVPTAGDVRRTPSAAPLLRTPREHRARGELRLHRRGPDMARQSALGRCAGLRPRRARRDQQARDHAAGGSARPRRTRGRGLRHQRLHRASRRRLRPVVRKCLREDAERYHAQQIESFADTQADLVSAMTLTHVEEAIGVTWAAQAIGIPAVISFTLETDGRLPSGTTLGDAIVEVDEATDAGPAYYMVNCAHPTHFEHVLADGGPWLAAAARDPRKRLVQEPRRARRGDRARLRRPRGPGLAVRLAGRKVSAADDPRRLLRDRRAPRRGDRADLRRLRMAAQRLDLGSPAHPRATHAPDPAEMDIRPHSDPAHRRRSWCSSNQGESG